MKDESLREALRSAARKEPATGDPYSRFELVRRRNALARGAVLIGVGVLLMSAFAFVFPNPLRSGPPAEFPTGGELDPRTSPVRLYEDAEAGYQLEYPSDWRVRGSIGGLVTFYVQTDPPFEGAISDLYRQQRYELEIPKTFFVQVTPLIGDNEPRAVDRSTLEALGAAGAIVTEGRIFLEQDGQRRTDQLRVFYAAEPLGGFRKIGGWCRSCRVEEMVVRLVPDRGAPALHIRIVAPDGESLTLHRFDALEIINSIERFLAR